MADGIARTSTPDAAAGNLIDVEVLTVNGSSVDRQRMRLGGLGAAELADVKNADPGVGSTLYGTISRIAGRVPPSFCASLPVVTRGTVGAAATQALPAASALANRRRITIRNLDATNDLELAAATFAYGAGWLLHAGESESFPWGPVVPIWLCASGASTNYAIIEEAE